MLFSPEQYVTIVEDLYAGTLDRASWDRAMIAISDMVRARGAALIAFNPVTGHVLRDEIHRLPSGMMTEYARTWSSQDSRLEYGRSAPVCSPFTELTLNIPKWRRTPILNEFLLPIDAPHSLPVWLRKSPTKCVALTLQGTRRRGPFQDSDLHALRRIAPHVSRALEIRDRLERANIQAETWSSGLDSLAPAIFVLDSEGRALESNAVAEQLLRADSGVQIRVDGTLSLRQPAGSELQRWILSGRPPARDAEGLLHVPRQDALPLSALLTPVCFRTSWVGRDPRWLLVIFDPNRRADPDPELIARDFGISTAEASLAAALAAGDTLSVAAVRLGVSLHTVRTQLKSIFRKTGIRSQIELARAIVLSPASRRIGSAMSKRTSRDHR